MAQQPHLSAAAVVYNNLCKMMMQQYFDGNHKGAEDLAYELLRHSDLPVLIRAYCHMVLATSRPSDGLDSFSPGIDFLAHAEAAVQTLEEAAEDGYNIDSRFMEEAIAIRDGAEIDHDALKRAAEEQEQSSEEEEPSDEEEEPSNEEQSAVIGGASSAAEEQTDISEEAGLRETESTKVEQEQDLPVGEMGNSRSFIVHQGLLTSKAEDTDEASQERR